MRVEGTDFPGPGVQGEAGRPVFQALITGGGLAAAPRASSLILFRWPLTLSSLNLSLI